VTRWVPNTCIWVILLQVALYVSGPIVSAIYRILVRTWYVVCGVVIVYTQRTAVSGVRLRVLEYNPYLRLSTIPTHGSFSLTHSFIDSESTPPSAADSRTCTTQPRSRRRKFHNTNRPADNFRHLHQECQVLHRSRSRAGSVCHLSFKYLVLTTS